MAAFLDSARRFSWGNTLNNFQNSSCLFWMSLLVVGPRVMFNLAHDDPPTQGPAKNNMSLVLVMACLARFSPYWDSRSSSSVIVTTCTCQRCASGKRVARLRKRHDNRRFVGVQCNKGDLCASSQTSQTRYIGIARQAKYGTIVIHKTKIIICIGISRLQMVASCNSVWDKETMIVLFTVVRMHAPHHSLETP